MMEPISEQKNKLCFQSAQFIIMEHKNIKSRAHKKHNLFVVFFNFGNVHIKILHAQIVRESLNDRFISNDIFSLSFSLKFSGCSTVLCSIEIKPYRSRLECYCSSYIQLFYGYLRTSQFLYLPCCPG